MPLYPANSGTSVKGTVPGASLVSFGDSYMAQTFAPGWHANQTMAYLLSITGGRLRPLAHTGIAGQTTAQFLARFATDVVAYAPHVCVMLTPGINDVDTDVAVATTKANLTAIFDAALAANIVMVTTTVPPGNQISTLARRQAVFDLNRWLLNQGATRQGLVVVDIWPLLSDPASATVQFLAALTTDGTHPSALGAYAIANAISTELTKILPGGAGPFASSLADPYELLPNPTMKGNTAGLATSMNSAGGVGTATKVTRTDGVQGEWQQWAHTSGTELLYQSSPAASVAPGDILTGYFEVQLDNTGAALSGSGVYVYLQTRTSGGAAVDTVQMFLADTTGFPTIAGTLIVPVGPFTAGASTDFVRAAMSITGTGGTFRLGRISVRKSTSP